jgi:hypothetical protein
MHVPAAAQLAHGWSRLSALTNAVAVLVVVPALLLLVPKYGATAAGWLWFGLNCGYCTVGVAAMHVRILKGELRAWWTNDVLLPLVAASAAAAATLALRGYVGTLERAGEAVFLVGAAIAMAAATALATPAGREGLAALVRLNDFGARRS